MIYIKSIHFWLIKKKSLWVWRWFNDTMLLTIHNHLVMQIDSRLNSGLFQVSMQFCRSVINPHSSHRDIITVSLVITSLEGWHNTPNVFFHPPIKSPISWFCFDNRYSCCIWYLLWLRQNIFRRVLLLTAFTNSVGRIYTNLS